MDAPLALAGAATLAAGAVWLALGLRLARRRVPRSGENAARAFSLWWMGLGAYSVVNAAAAIAVALGSADRALAVFVAYLQSAFVALMFWGLMSHLVYLHTGRATLERAVTRAYVVQGAALLALVAYLNPTGFRAVGASVEVAYERAPSTLSGLIVLVALVLPPVVGAIAYATLLRRVEDRTARVRVGVASGSIVALFGAALVGNALQGEAAIAFAPPIVGVLAALAVLAVYEPPRWVARRLRIGALRDEIARARPSEAAQRARGNQALDERVRNLV